MERDMSRFTVAREARNGMMRRIVNEGEVISEQCPFASKLMNRFKAGRLPGEEIVDISVQSVFFLRRLILACNMIGHVWTVDQDTHNTVTCEFYDREAHHQFFFTDPYLYDKACLSRRPPVTVV